MRRILVLAVLLTLALASLAFAQVERDPSSRHGTDEHARQSASAKPHPAPKPKPMLTVERAARLAGASITKAAQDVLPDAAVTSETDAAVTPEANAAVTPEAETGTAPASNGTGRVEVQTSALLKDDPEAASADSAAGQESDQTAQEQAQSSGSELAELVRQRSAELDVAAEQALDAQQDSAAEQPEAAQEDMAAAPATEAPSPATDAPATAEPPSPSAQPAASGDAEAAPAPEPQPETAAPAPVTPGKHLVPNRRQADEPLRSRDGSADPVERSVPQESDGPATATPAPTQPVSPAQPASTAPGERGTSLAQITGEPKPASPQPATTASAQPSAGFIAPAAGHSAPITLVLPSGQPHMPRYDVPASLKILKRGNPHEKLIALTFDDGPHPEYTSQLLAVLDYYDVQATFFCVGVQAQKHPQWVKMINQQGHEIANHTYDHFRLPKLPRSEKQYQIDENQRLIESLTGVTPRFMRPPGGQDDGETEQMLAQRKMVLAMWDVAINDTSHGRLEQDLLAVSLRKVRPGSVLLAHDGIQATIDMLPALIEKLRGEGYRFVTLSELASDM